MDIQAQTLNLYCKLLNISKENAKSIQALYESQPSAIWKSLLKVHHSMHTSNHNQAINELKLSKSIITSFVSFNNSKQNQYIHRKVLVCILANLINRLYLNSKYEDALTFFRQLIQQIQDEIILKQCLYNLFGFTSLLSLEGYNIQNNSEFKYPPEAQAKFFFIVGKIKRVSNKILQAKIAFERVLKINETIDIDLIITSRVYYYLSVIDHSKYNSQLEKIKKVNKKIIQQSAEEDKYSLYILKALKDKQLEIKKKSLYFSQKPTQEINITKQMLQMYLISMSRDRYQGLNEIFQKIKYQNNPNVLQQLLHSNIGKEVFLHFDEQFSKIKKILLKFLFRNLFSGKSLIKSANTSLLKSNIPLSSNIKQRLKTRDRSIPQDKVRAQEILKKCMKGSFLLKINFGSKSYENKFVRIQEKGLKWAQNQNQMQSSSSICKWKNVLGILYGKASQNLTKTKYKAFQSEKCFSLITLQRSYDFYSDIQSQIYFWLQGISYQLQLFHNNSQKYPFYSKGRAMWKLMLFKMRKYCDPKKKYKNLNAGSVLGFKKHLMISK